MDVSLLIRLIDQASGPAQKIKAGLQGISGVVSGMKQGFGQAIREGFSVQNIETATQNAERALTNARSRLLGAFGMAVSIAAPVMKAASFDQSMRGLDKVLDVTHSRLLQLRKFALDTSAIVPIAAGSLVELMSEAAQGGVPEAELEAFSLYVARAAVAFDMAGAEIGERFAKLRNVYRLNQQGIVDLGDATNHLSNKMAAKASEITDFANRAAGAAKTLNLTAVQMSAVGAAMIAAGIAPETAARGLSALSNRVIAGGKDVDKAFKMIGMTRKQFQKDLAADGSTALQKLFETMSTSPKGMEALVKLVGQDFADDFAKFLGNPELLRQALELVAEQANYAGSATEEAGKQAEGAEKRWELLRNKLERIAIIVGDKLLPTFFQAADVIGELLDKVSAWTDANPELATGLAQGVAGLLAFNIASRLLAFGVAALRLPLINLAAMFLKFDKDGRNIATGWRLMRGAATALRLPLSFLGGAFGELVRHVPGLRNAVAGFRMLAMISGGGVFGALAGAITAVGTALATITAPAWAVIGVLVAAGFAVWKFWDRISSFSAGFASVFADAFSGIGERLASFADQFIRFNAAIFGIDPATVERFKASMASAFDFSGLIEGARQTLSEFWSWLGSWFSQEQLSEGEQAEMYAAGARLAQSIIDGFKSMIGAIGDLLTFDLQINWPEPPAWLTWLAEKHRDAAAAVKDKVDGWRASWNGTDEEPGAKAIVTKTVNDISGGGRPEAGAGGQGSALSNLWSNVKDLHSSALDLVRGGEQGGAAVARGGEDAAAALSRVGRELLGVASAVSAAAGKISSAAAGASRGGGGVGTAINNAKTGALHGGTE
jgi:TP901 family phage tail tape measure protein